MSDSKKAVKFLRVCDAEQKNWIGLQTRHVPNELKTMTEKAIVAFDNVVVEMTPDEELHMTMAWWEPKGEEEDAIRWAKIKKQVEDWKLTEEDIRFDDRPYLVQPEHTKKDNEAYWCVGLILSSRAQALWDQLKKENSETVNPAEKDGRKVPPHVTLAIVERIHVMSTKNSASSSSADRKTLTSNNNNDSVVASLIRYFYEPKTQFEEQGWIEVEFFAVIKGINSELGKQLLQCGTRLRMLQGEGSYVMKAEPFEHTWARFWAQQWGGNGSKPFKTN
jgi:hypothetical protein